YKGEIYEGEHEAIIEDEVFDRVQQILDAKSCGRGPRRNRNPDYLLAGLLYCRCGDAMTTSSARGRKGREYRYYLCRTRQVEGPDACDHPRIPSGEIEKVILDRVQDLCRNDSVRQGVTERLDQGKTEVGQGLAAERAQVQARIDVLNREARDLLALFKHGEGGAGARVVSERLGELETEIDTLRIRTGELDDQIRGLSEAVGRVNTALDLLDSFDELWDALVPEERLELLRLLIERIDIDEPAGKLLIAFHDLAAPFPALAPPPDDDPPASPEPVVAALMEGFAP
ncbi:MAG: recombinase family protein, partial [Candidatus Methylomirabilis sp.]|nr:recombinase family protein [Deltaproteobacteria bacterium]